ncbi:hypothetical protein SAMN04487844_105255 [Methylobacterium sp. yr596]|nr:hypothetical protein SAMN04487844_105255 [Methylobacterium sp. yr596]
MSAAGRHLPRAVEPDPSGPGRKKANTREDHQPAERLNRAGTVPHDLHPCRRGPGRPQPLRVRTVRRRAGRADARGFRRAARAGDGQRRGLARGGRDGTARHRQGDVLPHPFRRSSGARRDAAGALGLRHARRRHRPRRRRPGPAGCADRGRGDGRRNPAGGARPRDPAPRDQGGRPGDPVPGAGGLCEVGAGDRPGARADDGRLRAGRSPAPLRPAGAGGRARRPGRDDPPGPTISGSRTSRSPPPITARASAGRCCGGPRTSPARSGTARSSW